MAFLGRLFGGGQGKARPRPKIDIPSPPRGPVNDATFTPTSEDATFTLVDEEIQIDQDEFPEGSIEASVFSGETIGLISSNVSWMRYDQAQNQLYLGFIDGTTYQYSQVLPEEALDLIYSPSHGKWVWDHLRVRGTVFGWRKPYQLFNNANIRLWYRAGAKSIERWEGVGPAGEAQAGWHPAQTSEDPKAQGWKKPQTYPFLNLGKRRGKKK